MTHTPPQTGPERGQALRRLLRQHDLTVAQFARLAGVNAQTIAHLINGDPEHTVPERRGGVVVRERPLGRDLATLTPRTAGKLARVIGSLEPTWADADLWRALGIPAEQRGHWTLGREPQAPSRPSGELLTIHVPETWGHATYPLPGTVSVRPGESGDLLVWRTGNTVLIAPPGTQTPGELLGAFAGFMPDQSRGRVSGTRRDIPSGHVPDALKN